MRTGSTLTLSGNHHKILMHHLFPGDGKEAAAILLCSRIINTRVKFVVRDILVVPHDACERTRDFLRWPGAFIEDALDEAEYDNLSLILVHSHPGGLFEFSDADIESDLDVMPSIFAAKSKQNQEKIWHGTAIMIPSGGMRAKLYDEMLAVAPVELVSVYGDDLRFFWNHEAGTNIGHRPMAFSAAMTAELGLLSACVVGISGTGSIVTEQIARMGFGEIILVDFDKVEAKNLNRILNTSISDVSTNRFKVEVAASAISAFRPDSIIKKFATGIDCKDTVIEASIADVIFCCVDSHSGRQLCDLMASAFLQPLFDVGVTIPVRKIADGRQGILDAVGRIDYVQPGGATLRDRGVFTPATLAAEELAKNAPDAYASRVREGYMPGTLEEAPSVISLNMRAASTCVNEFLARAYPFRTDPNHLRARIQFSLAECEEEYVSESAFPRSPSNLQGIGFRKPLLGLPGLEG